jgi:hypothetical protein
MVLLQNGQEKQMRCKTELKGNLHDFKELFSEGK